MRTNEQSTRDFASKMGFDDEAIDELVEKVKRRGKPAEVSSLDILDAVAQALFALEHGEPDRTRKLLKAILNDCMGSEEAFALLVRYQSRP